jgi:hypothetical protein
LQSLRPVRRVAELGSLGKPSMSRAQISVVEYASFRSKASRLVSEEERAALIEFLAANPRAGKEYDGTGGVRHIRWPIAENKKKDQVEVGYYYGDGSTPILLVSLIKTTEGNLLSKVIRGLAGGV